MKQAMNVGGTNTIVTASVCQEPTRVHSDFDSGNIEVVDASNPLHTMLAIKADLNSDHRQWFHFRADRLSLGSLHCFSLVNAAQASYSEAWDGYQAVASYDRKHWFRLPTRYDEQGLHFELEAQQQQAWFAYFEPYTRERHAWLIDLAIKQAGAERLACGKSIEGRAIEVLRIARAPLAEKLKIWIIAQQHPGEHMAEWFVEGAIKSLAQPSAAIHRLLSIAELYLVPNMNPDGAYRGHLRCNAAGVDLNRAWQAPCPVNSPEVLFVQQQMQLQGVDIFLDIHGDEEIPYVFAAGCEGIPGFTPRLEALEQLFRQGLIDHGAEFQLEHGYPPEPPNDADLSIACNFVGHTYDCLALTIEMPFKDHNLSPQSAVGWNGERSKQLGSDVLLVLEKMLKQLR